MDKYDVTVWFKDRHGEDAETEVRILKNVPAESRLKASLIARIFYKDYGKRIVGASAEPQIDEKHTDYFKAVYYNSEI
jgi:hypothetical protein